MELRKSSAMFRKCREELDAMGEKVEAQVFYPRQDFCTDNGAMIALAGHLRLNQSFTPCLL
jgi:tRNA A37 threonylcarbamoyltransferase TsaD